MKKPKFDVVAHCLIVVLLAFLAGWVASVLFREPCEPPTACPLCPVVKECPSLKKKAKDTVQSLKRDFIEGALGK